MRRALVQSTVMVGLLTASLFGASVASISSASSFELRGARVTVEGIPFWPMRVGDSVTAGTSPVYIRFGEGSRVVLQAGSRAVLEDSDNRLSFRLLSGEMSFDTAATSTIRFYSGNTLVRGRGTVSSNHQPIKSPGDLKAQVTRPRPPPPNPVSDR